MHIIRLRSAWEPATDSRASEIGRCFERSFGKPTNLGTERVFLVIEPTPVGDVRLNGQLLSSGPTSPAPPAAGFRHEVTASLNARNLLSIAGDSATFDHQVRLEIVE